MASDSRAGREFDKHFRKRREPALNGDEDQVWTRRGVIKCQMGPATRQYPDPHVSGLQFLVTWEDYGETQSTWEEGSTLIGTPFHQKARK